MPAQSRVCSTAMASSANLRMRLARGRGIALGEMGDEFGNVLPPLGEARHLDGNDAEPVIEILAEAADGDEAGRSRLVEETTRISTFTFLAPPTRWKVWSTSTRSTLPWVSIGMSASSSM